MDFVEPSAVLKELSLMAGAKVGDFGAGIGAFALLAAQAVGPDGRVYAFDVQKDLLARLSADASAKKITNIETLWCDLDKRGSTKLADKILDSAIIANAFFQIEDKENFLQEVARVMKPGAQVLLLDWQDSFGGLGPQPEKVISQEKAEQYFTKYGFNFVRGQKAGEHHYLAIFSKT